MWLRIPTGPETKTCCASDVQQQFTRPDRPTEGADRVRLAHERVSSGALVNTVKTLQVTPNAGNFLSRWATAATQSISWPMSQDRQSVSLYGYNIVHKRIWICYNIFSKNKILTLSLCLINLAPRHEDVRWNGITPDILSLGTRWRSVVSFTPQSPNPRENNLRY
jgi:hypothetical protein